MNVYWLPGLGQNQGIGLSGGQTKFVPVLADTAAGCADTGAGCAEIGIKATIPMQRRTARPAVLFVDMSILSVHSFRATEAPLTCLRDHISAQKSSSFRYRNYIKKKAALAVPQFPKRNFVLFDSWSVFLSAEKMKSRAQDGGHISCSHHRSSFGSGPGARLPQSHSGSNAHAEAWIALLRLLRAQYPAEMGHMELPE
jgi:hypothetical protein